MKSQHRAPTHPSPARTPLVLALGLSAALGCSSDPEEFKPWTLETLSREQGLSIRVPLFEVPSGKEIQDCYFFDVPSDAGELWISRVHTAINPGSHHLNLFRVRTRVNLKPEDGEPISLGDGLMGTVVRGGEPGSSPCWKSPNWADWPLLANSQKSSPSDPYTDWQLPEGVAARLTPGETIMIQTHYVNATTQATPTQGLVGVNLHRFEGSSPMELGTLFATTQSIRICRSNPTPRYDHYCPFTGGPVTIAAANGHFHSRGRKFEAFALDGLSQTASDATRFYLSNSWDDPPMARDLAVQVPQGGGVQWSCEYQWSEPPAGCEAVDARDMSGLPKDCCYTFGPVVETSEHCNVFVYYYPKAGSDLFCN